MVGGKVFSTEKLDYSQEITLKFYLIEHLENEILKTFILLSVKISNHSTLIPTCDSNWLRRFN